VIIDNIFFFYKLFKISFTVNLSLSVMLYFNVGHSLLLFSFRYLISGDADGKMYIWDWKSTKLFSKFKAHDDVCISVLWHPHETSKIASAGWDGVIKYWD